MITSEQWEGIYTGYMKSINEYYNEYTNKFTGGALLRALDELDIQRELLNDINELVQDTIKENKSKGIE